MNDPEDFDAFEDADGCPDPDNDGDGVLDVDDGPVRSHGSGACMHDAEDIDGDRDGDGCPEEDRLVTLTCDAIEINDRVYFDTGSDAIQQRSFAVLDDVAEVMTEAMHIRLLSVEGHTDSQGRSSANLELSERRAAAVARYLTDAGIDPDRIRSAGYGEDRPIDTNDTSEGRQVNRRVEFLIIEQDEEGCTE